MDSLAVLSGGIHPLLYGSPLEPEGGFDGRTRAGSCMVGSRSGRSSRLVERNDAAPAATGSACIT